MPLLRITDPDRRRKNVRVEHDPVSLTLACEIVDRLDAGRQKIPAAALTWAERVLASAGFAVVSAQAAEIATKVEAGQDILLSVLEDVLYAVWSGPLAEWW